MAAELAWPVEIIPHRDSVFMRAHRHHFNNGKLAPGVFREREGGMSVDWEKYSSAEDTKNRGKIPDDNAVIGLHAGDVRGINSLTVDHTPEPVNRAHAEVRGMPVSGEELTEIRVKLLRIAAVTILLPKATS